MIKVIRNSLFSQLYYWRKPVMDRFDRHHQNGYIMTGIGTQYWITRSSNIGKKWCQIEISQPTPDRHTAKIIQIPIVTRHLALPWLRPAVSSLVACPTLPSDLRAIVRVHCYVGRHLTTLNNKSLSPILSRRSAIGQISSHSRVLVSIGLSAIGDIHGYWFGKLFFILLR
jgi:hypothetical protein